MTPHVLMLTPHTNRVVALYMDTWLVPAIDRRWHPLQEARGSFIERSAVHTGTFPSSRRLGRIGQPQPRRVGRNTRMPLDAQPTALLLAGARRVRP